MQTSCAKTLKQKFPSKVTSTDDATPEPYADQSMQEEPVGPGSSSEVAAINKEPLETYIAQSSIETDQEKPDCVYQTLDYLSPQRRGNPNLFLESLSHPLHAFQNKSHYIFDSIDVSTKQSEEPSYQPVGSSNKDSIPEQHWTKIVSSISSPR